MPRKLFTLSELYKSCRNYLQEDDAGKCPCYRTCQKKAIAIFLTKEERARSASRSPRTLSAQEELDEFRRHHCGESHEEGTGGAAAQVEEIGCKADIE